MARSLLDEAFPELASPPTSLLDQAFPELSEASAAGRRAAPRPPTAPVAPPPTPASPTPTANFLRGFGESAPLATTRVPSQAEVRRLRPGEIDENARRAGLLEPSRVGEAIQPQTPAEAVESVLGPAPRPLTPEALAVEQAPPVLPAARRGSVVRTPQEQEVGRWIAGKGPVGGTLAVIADQLVRSDPATAVALGARYSLSGLVGTVAGGGGAGPDRTEQQYDPTYFDKALETAVSIAGDPLTGAAFILGGAAGGAAMDGAVGALLRKFGVDATKALITRGAAQAVGSGAGSFAVFDAARKTLEQTIQTQRGEPSGYEPGTREPYYGIRLGEVAKAAGKGAVTGTVLGGTGAALNPALLRLGAEVGVFASVPPLLEGHTPTVDDVINAGVMVAGLKAAGGLKDATRAALEKPLGDRSQIERQRVRNIPPDVQAGIVTEAGQALQARLDRLRAETEAQAGRFDTMQEQANRLLVNAAVTGQKEVEANREESARIRRETVSTQRGEPVPIDQRALAESIRAEVERQVSARLAQVGLPGTAEPTTVQPEVSVHEPRTPVGPERPVPATFLGWQERPGREPMALYNLTAAIPGHPVESTVSAETLRAAGLEPPEPPMPPPVREPIAPRPPLPTQPERVPLPRTPEPAVARVGKTTQRGTAEPFDPDDINQLVRFVRANGGLAASPTGDLAGEYRALPLYLKNRRGLNPDRMAQAVSEAAGRPISDADLLTRLGRTAQSRAEVVASAAGMERATTEADTLAQISDAALVRELADRTGMSDEDARAVLARRPTEPVSAKPDQMIAESDQRATLQQALRDFFDTYPAEDPRPEVFDLVPALRERFGDAATVARDVFGGDVEALRREMESAKAGVSEAPRRAVASLKDLGISEARRQRRGGGPDTSSPEFRRWFGESRVVDETGAPKVVYRGDYRADRVGKKFSTQLATSGRFYFTEDPEIASRYAVGKPDVHAQEAMQDFSDQYTFADPRGGRRRLNLREMWFALSREQQERAARMLPDIGFDERTGMLTTDGSSALMGQDEWAQYVREARGNWLEAAKEVWLSSGSLFDVEDRAKFVDILNAVGVRGAEFDTADIPASAVTPVYLRIERPLDTGAIPDAVVERLRAVARADRTRPRAGGDYDQWDKQRPAAVFVERLEEDLRNGTTFAWTSVPELITRELQRLGYDGIKDTGGKYGGPAHRVWIAFEPWQIKSRFNRGTFDIGTENISEARRQRPEMEGAGRVPAVRTEPRSYLDYPIMRSGDPIGTRFRIEYDDGRIVEWKKVNKDRWKAEGERAREGTAVWNDFMAGHRVSLSWRRPDDPAGVWQTAQRAEDVVETPSGVQSVPRRDVIDAAAEDLGSTRPIENAPLAFEPTPVGEQAVVPGTPRRAFPTTPLRTTVAQRPVEETRLFGAEAERRAREAQPGLPGISEAERRIDPAPIFYSKAQKVVTDKMATAAPAAVVRNLLVNGGVTADEMKWTGLDDWLRERGTAKVTKDEVTRFLRDNEVRVEEVVKGGPKSEVEVRRDRVARELFDRPFAELDAEARVEVDTEIGIEATQFDNREPAETKFERLTLPGAAPGSYRELLLTLPERPDSPAAQARQRVEASSDRLEALAAGLRSQLQEALMRRPLYQQMGERGAESALNRARTIVARLQDVRGYYPDELVDARDLLGVRHPQLVAFLEEVHRNYDLIDEAQQVEKTEYRSPHWNEPNVLAHVRFNERVDAAGRRVLFVEELQSDWAQTGKREGFKDERAFESLLTPEEKELRDLNKVTWSNLEWTPEHKARAEELQRTVGVSLQEKARQHSSRIPAAPYVGKTDAWVGLSLKRMLRWAAEHGYDAMAWTTGEQQSERYSLSKHIDTLRYAEFGGGRYTVEAIKNGQALVRETVDEPGLERLVGKDLARKIVAGVGDPVKGSIYTDLRGVDLKIGGEGMRAFYDQIVPAFLNRYGKKWGARVGETEIPTRPDESMYRVTTAGGHHEFVEAFYRARGTTLGMKPPSDPDAWIAVMEFEPGRWSKTGPDRFDSRDAAEAWVADANREAAKMVRVPTMSITPEMKRSVLEEGQTSFMPRAGETPRQEHQRNVRALAAGVPIEGTPYRVVDTDEALVPDNLQRLAQTPYARDVTEAVARAFDDVRRRLSVFDRRMDHGEFAGLTVNMGQNGVTIHNVPGRERDPVLLNVHAMAMDARGQLRDMLDGAEPPTDMVVRRTANAIAEIIVHELTHQQIRERHDADFDAAFALNARRLLPSWRVLTQTLARAFQGEVYDAITRDAATLDVPDRRGVAGDRPRRDLPDERGVEERGPDVAASQAGRPPRGRDLSGVGRQEPEPPPRPDAAARGVPDTEGRGRILEERSDDAGWIRRIREELASERGALGEPSERLTLQARGERRTFTPAGAERFAEELRGQGLTVEVRPAPGSPALRQVFAGPAVAHVGKTTQSVTPPPPSEPPGTELTGPASPGLPVRAPGEPVYTPNPDIDAMVKQVERVPIGERAGRVKRGAITTMVNQFEPVRQLTEELKRVGLAPAAGEAPHETVELAKNVMNGESEAFAIEYGRVLDGLRKEDPALVLALRDYLTARQFLTRLDVLESRGTTQQGLGGPPTGLVNPRGFDRAKTLTELARQRAELGPDNLARVEQAARDIWGLNRRILDAAHDTGLIGDAGYRTLVRRGDQYVPFQVLDFVAESGDVKAPQQPFDVKWQSIFKRMEGTESDVRNVLEATYDKAFRAIATINRNRAARAVTDLGDALPDVVRQLGPAETGVKPGWGVVSAFEQGKRVDYQVPEDIARSMKFLDAKPLSGLARLILQPAKTALTAGATGWNTAFIVPNAIRDAFRAAVYSKWGVSTPRDLFDFGARWLRALGHVYHQDDVFLEYLRSGAAFSTYQRGLRPETFVRAKAGGRSLADRLNLVKALINGAERFNAMVEAAPKIATMERGQQAGAASADVAYETANYGGSPNFGRAGTMGRELSLIFMFFNPRLQGTAANLRRLRETETTGGRMTLASAAGLRVAIGVALPATLLWAWNRQYGDDLEQIPQMDRQRYHIVLLPETYQASDGATRRKYLKVAKEETAQLLAPMIEKGLDRASGRQGQLAEALLFDFLGNVSPVSFNVHGTGVEATTRGVASGFLAGLNPALRIPTEVGLNYVGYKQGAITPRGLSEHAEPTEQRRPTTSPTATSLASAVPRDIARVLNVNPITVEYALTSGTGGLGQTAIDTVDWLRGKSLPETVSDWERAARMPFVSRFLGAGGGQRDRETEEAFYRAMDRSRRLRGSLQMVAQQGLESPRLREIADDPDSRMLLAIGPSLDRLAVTLATIRKAQVTVTHQSTAPLADKQAMLAQLAEARTRTLDAFRALDRMRPEFQPTAETAAR